MTNLIIDPMHMNPHLYYLIPNSYYYTPKGDRFKHIWCGSESEESFNKKYKIDFIKQQNYIENLLLQKYKFKHLFLTLNILSTKKIHQGPDYILWIKLYKELYQKFKHNISGKIIIIDNHASDYDPCKYLDELEIKYDLILKRVYSERNKHRYAHNVHTYPFVMCTSNDPFYTLFNTQLITHVNSVKNKKIYWAGSLFEYNERFDDDNIFEKTDRSSMINNIRKINPYILNTQRTPYHLFRQLIASHKYALDIRGCSRLNKRLYEILSTNTLLLAEKIDIIWPFEEGDKFSDECFFSTPDELYSNYIKFECDGELYKKCLDNQLYIVKKYFNNDWVYNYINNIIN